MAPVWIGYDAVADRRQVNTARGRWKERNVTADLRGGASMLDPEGPYRYCSVRGKVTDVTEDGPIEHVDRLARRYIDVEEHSNTGEKRGPRVIIKTTWRRSGSFTGDIKIRLDDVTPS